MEWHFNELSLNGQYSDEIEVRGAFEEILALRARRPDLGKALYCSRNLSIRPATPNLSLREAVSLVTDSNFRSSLFRWLGKAGPFWEDSQIPYEENLFYFDQEDVTDQGLGEVARRHLIQIAAEAFSLRSSDVRFDERDLTIVHGLLEAPIRKVVIRNVIGVDELFTKQTLAPTDWPSTLAIAATNRKLILSTEIQEQLRPKPFHRNLAERILQLLAVLNKIGDSTDDSGALTNAGLETVNIYFVGQNAWFSNENPEDKGVFMFKDPLQNRKIYCPWHGKTKQGDQTRVHFQWPRPTGQREIKIVYIGTKLTKW